MIVPIIIFFMLAIASAYFKDRGKNDRAIYLLLLAIIVQNFFINKMNLNYIMEIIKILKG